MHDLLAVLDAPDPAAARADFEAHYVDRLAKRVSAGPRQRERAELVAALMLGLATALRPLRLVAEDEDWVVERYGALVQSLIDG